MGRYRTLLIIKNEHLIHRIHLPNKYLFAFPDGENREIFTGEDLAELVNDVSRPHGGDLVLYVNSCYGCDFASAAAGGPQIWRPDSICGYFAVIFESTNAEMQRIYDDARGGDVWASRRFTEMAVRLSLREFRAALRLMCPNTPLYVHVFSVSDLAAQGILLELYNIPNNAVAELRQRLN